MPKWRTILFWIAGLFLFFSIAGFFLVPPIAKHLLIKNLSEALQRDVSIQQIKANPYNLTVVVRGFAIKEKETSETILSFEEFFIDIHALSIFKRAIILSKVSLTKPYIKVIRNEDGSYNWSDLVEKTSEGPSPPAKKSKPVQFSINNIVVSGGTIDFLDAPKEVFHEVTDLNLAVPFVSNMKYHVQTFIQPRFSALINDDPFTIEGKTKPFADSLETVFDININNLDLADYLAYVPNKKHFNLLSGSLNLIAKVSYIQHAEKKPTLEVTGKMTLNDLNLADDKKNPLLKVGVVDFEIASVKPLEDLIHISRMSISSPDINMRRKKDGTIDIVTITTLLIGTAHQKEDANSSHRAQDKNPMSLLIDVWQVKDGKMKFHDSMTQEPVTIEAYGIVLDAKGFSLEKGSKTDFQFSFLLGKTGKVNGKGTIGLEPIAANLSLDMKGVGINTFQPYFTDKVRMYISSGSINTSGTLGLDKPEGKDVSAKYTGKLLINQLHAANKEDYEELLRWQTLSFEDLVVGYNPTYYSAKGISLSDFFAAITIEPDGSLNLHHIVAAEEEAAKPDVKASPKTPAAQSTVASESTMPADMVIGGITLQGGTIRFTDRSIKPNYSANLTQIGGRVSSLSMKKDTASDVEVRGKYNDYVPLEIAGKINPWKEHFFVDLTASFKNFELSPLSPYSGKYVGYTIDKGQLSFDLKYLIVQRKIEAQNRILFDQLTFGEKVESPDAIKLPVKLAVTLLKDRQGKINLDIPVTGNLDDPQFSIWSIVWKIIKNLLVKAATSPFALLGALFGGGEDLSFVEFDYGRSSLTDTAIKKLETLNKALQDRPAVNVEIVGYVDPEKDREGLKNLLLSRRVKMQKAKDLAKKSEAPARVDDVKIGPEEYEKYLRLAYEAEKFAKPRNIIGLTKKLPVPEMEKLMLTNIAVKDEDLRNLALERATSVKDFILRSDKVAPNRLFIVQAQNFTPEKKENLKASRVDFRIK
ncbi:MAG TPA: DUF748 domain-containing protein [Syntrophorhabdus sp.]|nr:DUF748 domain-containing protein [Syntrophorhabdus sp.]